MFEFAESIQLFLLQRKRRNTLKNSTESYGFRQNLTTTRILNQMEIIWVNDINWPHIRSQLFACLLFTNVEMV